jgi:putative peptidoglycan lipid II flippase
VGVAIGVALLPQLSRAVQAKDHSEAQTAMDQAITFAMALTLPAAAAMASIPFFLSDALYTRGAFTVYDAHNTASALFFYGLGVPAFVLQQLYSRAFFARGDTRSPMRFALISIAVNIGAGVVFFHFFGIRGIAAATALASWINVAQSAWKLHRMDQYRPSAATWSRLGRIVAASLGMAALLATASFFRPEIQAAVGRKEVAIILVAIAGAAVYPLLLFAFGGMTLTEIKAMVRRPKADLPPPGETG